MKYVSKELKNDNEFIIKAVLENNDLLINNEYLKDNILLHMIINNIFDYNDPQYLIDNLKYIVLSPHFKKVFNTLLSNHYKLILKNINIIYVIEECLTILQEHNILVFSINEVSPVCDDKISIYKIKKSIKNNFKNKKIIWIR